MSFDQHLLPATGDDEDGTGTSNVVPLHPRRLDEQFDEHVRDVELLRDSRPAHGRFTGHRHTYLLAFLLTGLGYLGLYWAAARSGAWAVGAGCAIVWTVVAALFCGCAWLSDREGGRR